MAEAKQVPQEDPWDTIVKDYAEKKGMDPKMADAYLRISYQKVGVDHAYDFVEKIGQNAAMLKQFPSETQKDIIGMMAFEAMKGEKKENPMDDITSLATRMTVLRSALKDKDESGKTDQATLTKIDELQKTIATMQKAEEQRELEAIETGFKDKMESLEKTLSTKIESLRTDGTAPPDAIQQMTELVEKLKGLKEVGETIHTTFAPQGAPSPSAEEQMENLKKLGYKIEGPKTLEELEKGFDERMKKVAEETEKRVREQVNSDEKKMAMLVDLGETALGALLPVVTEKSSEGTLEVAKKALKVASQGA